MPFGVWTRVGLRKHVLDGGPDPHEKGQFGIGNIICTANGWLKEQDQQCSSTTESKLWRNSGPSAFQLGARNYIEK